MSGRVLSSEQAKSAIQQIQGIINGGLTDQISQLDSQGKTLSDPNVWDGPVGGAVPELDVATDPVGVGEGEVGAGGAARPVASDLDEHHDRGRRCLIGG